MKWIPVVFVLFFLNACTVPTTQVVEHRQVLVAPALEKVFFLKKTKTIDVTCTRIEYY